MCVWRWCPNMDANHTSGAPGGYERRDANARNLLLFAVTLFVVLLLVAGVSAWVFQYFGRVQKLGPPATPFEQARALPPLPQLQAHPVLDLEELHAKEQHELDSYGWVDRTHGIVRIPISRAMDLIMERGLPTRPAAPAGSTSGQPPQPKSRPGTAGSAGKSPSGESVTQRGMDQP
jgi:hypothetical protein